jgi:hypothetical protein
VLPDREEGYVTVVAQLVARHPMSQLSLVVPTGEALTTRERTWLSERSVDLRSCADLFVADERERIVARCAIRQSSASDVDEAVCPAEPRCLALCFTHHRLEPVRVLSDDDLAAERVLRGTVDHFVDALLPSPQATTRVNGKLRKVALTQGEVSMLTAYLARYAAGREPCRPERLQLPNLSTAASHREAFKSMRRKVDFTTTSRRKFHIFGSRQSFAGGSAEHFIDPGDATFCFLIRPDQFEAVRQAALKPI